MRWTRSARKDLYIKFELADSATSTRFLIWIMAASLESLKKEIWELGTIESQPDSFYEELMDFGIETGDQFEDSYQGQHK